MELKVVTPSIKSYQFIAFPLSIIEQYNESKKWLYNNFIQLAYDKNKNSPVPFCFYMFDYTINPYLDVIKLTRGIRSLVDFNIIKFAEKAIENEYYLYLNVDEYFIPNRRSYNHQHLSHDILVYGFDKKRQVLKVLGYDKYMRFASSEVPYDEFMNAFTNLDKIKNDCEQICLFKTKIEQYEVNGDIIKERLIDYVESKNTSQQYADLKVPWERSYGLSTYDSITADLVDVKRNPLKKIDPRNTLIILEHKKLMKERAEYLFSNGIVNQEIDLLAYAELQELSRIIHLLCLKYNIKRDVLIIEDIMKMIHTLKVKEEHTYCKLIESL